jgi:hypothetical protein
MVIVISVLLVVNLNYDMLGSPNYMFGIYHGRSAKPSTPAEAIQENVKISETFREWFDKQIYLENILILVVKAIMVHFKKLVSLHVDCSLASMKQKHVNNVRDIKED